MYLKKVEIQGFKSFANRTVLEFLSVCNFGGNKANCGITAVVGPNGSGKSNISDAIKWAMGEQSMKTLRGKKSEDVIFAGSAAKTRLSSAHVTLVFDNSDKRIPIEFSEVVITRKVFRSGESEYLINGSKVRLLDIAELLAKAGVGKESYCVITQGMTDATLRATPLERRMVLEDAAGVKQYQIRKERALKKIISTRDNIERTRSLVREIEPHLKMLKRQAEKAQQGKEVAASLKEKQTTLYSFLWHSFQKERTGLTQERDSLGAKMMNAQREVDALSEMLAKEAPHIEKGGHDEGLEKEKSALQARLNEIGREMIITEGRIVVEQEKLASQKLIEIIPVDLRYVQQKLAEIRTAQEKLIERVEKAESMEEFQEIKELARAIQQQLYDLHSQAGKGEVEVKKDNSKEVAEIQTRLNQLQEKKTVLAKGEADLKEKLQKASVAIEEQLRKEREQRELFFKRERELRAKQEELNILKDKFNDAKIRLARIEVREEDLVGEIRSFLKTEPGSLSWDGVAIDQGGLERDIARLKMQMEQIGGIDPLVVQEYQETNARFDFLTGELADLEQAITGLESVVAEMDQRIRQEFEKAYAAINAEFTKYFRIIFGGGNAYLKKIKIQSAKSKSAQEEGAAQEEEDMEQEQERVGEVGVDIFACPPGKKISNLSMLSGGERSLTAIALLFAIIAYNPPPFAILDEVEAALDEANSRRFGKILQELSANTQFVAITHNRETMRQASLLYGVTMGDDAISKILSVRLDQVGQDGKINQ
ncbi:MAG TPA: AAA family ATPase [Candidatus Moranbacteria bacterium]|nr:AAA family ATPase [Candidatus Moranbacteria bacterium]